MDGTALTLTGIGLLAITGLSTALLRIRSKYARLEASLSGCEHERKELKRRLGPVLDVEAEAKRLRAGLETERQKIADETSRLRAESDGLRQRYSQGLQKYEALEAEVRSLEEDLENISYGLYKPHFTYADTEAYKTALERVRDKQKEMIQRGQAAVCGTTWAVGGSKREGERMIKQYEKLILRGFNAQSEAAIANVSWNNYHVMRTRIEKTFEALNKLGTVMQVSVTTQYRDARLEELQLVFEAVEKKQQEREEQRRIRAEQREEERVQRELLREKEEAEEDEAKYQKALERAKRDMENARDAEREAMQALVEELEADLAAAQNRKERAIAQAELTKVGHVYIISNIGALGEGVLKIGLTRRLDPEERVQELGDASVPFPFDIHALIYSEDAPELETKLHNQFWERRINWANDRKEFFKVTIDEVGSALRQFGLSGDLLAIPEAREYRQTLAAIEESKKITSPTEKVPNGPRFPRDPFAEDEGQSSGALASPSA